jgi:hypothetical protein
MQSFADASGSAPVVSASDSGRSTILRMSYCVLSRETMKAMTASRSGSVSPTGRQILV